MLGRLNPGRINHVQLMLYAGLFTWGCVGIPLVLRGYFTEGLQGWELLGWRISYFIFGIVYVLLIRRIGKGRGHPLDPRRADQYPHLDRGQPLQPEWTRGRLLLVVAGIYRGCCRCVPG